MVAVLWLHQADLRSARRANGTTSSGATLAVTSVTNLSLDLTPELTVALQETNPIQRSIQFGRLLRQWFKENPEAALAYLRQMPPGSEYTEGLMMLLPDIGKSYPERALNLAQELVKNNGDQAIYSALFDQFARRNMNEALHLLDLVTLGPARQTALRALASHWAANDLSGAINWAQQMSDDSERSVAMEAALLTLTKQDPNRSLDLARQYLTGDACGSGRFGQCQTIDYHRSESRRRHRRPHARRSGTDRCRD